MSSGNRDEWAWFTRAQAAELCGTSPRNFDERIRQHLPDDSTRGSGRNLRYHGAGIVAAMVAYRQPAAVVSPESDDPLLSGAATPALERYRSLKADLAEIDVGERRGRIVRSAVISDAIKGGLSAMRQTGDRLTRQFGNDAGQLYNEGIDDFEAAARQVIQDADSRDDADRQHGGKPSNAVAPVDR
jgi:hypothetical protein